MGCCTACCKATTDGERVTDPENYAIHVKEGSVDTRQHKTIPVATEAFSEAFDDPQSSVAGCCDTVCRAITDKAIRSTDTEDDIKAKRYGIPVALALIGLASFFLLDPMGDVADIGRILGTAVCVFFLVVAFTNTMSATNALKATLVLWLLCVYTFDWTNAAHLGGR
eukprot:Hpha_TRINITY_DN10302_c0_g2::TRINITY_DN10302_c0_g2_i2::g.116225::m.116225